MANKRYKQIHRQLTIKLKYIAVPGAEARLAQAVNLLLKSAAMNDAKALETNNSKMKNLSTHDAEGNLGERIVRDKG